MILQLFQDDFRMIGVLNCIKTPSIVKVVQNMIYFK